MTPQVSVIVPFFNGERFLEETIESVLAQTFDDWDLWLIDDGSSDGSRAIADRYSARHPSRIHAIEHDGRVNRGAAASRNHGIRASQGELIALLDADDVWLERKLEEQVALLRERPQVGMLYGSSRYWHAWSGEPLDLQRDFVPDPIVATETVHAPPSLLLQLYPLGTAPTPCPSDIVLRRGAFERIGGFEEHFHGAYQLYEDQAFLAKIFLEEQVYVSSVCWDLYRIHSESCVVSVNADGHYHEVRHFYLKWFTDYLDRKGIRDPQLRSALQRARRVYEPSMLDRIAARLPWRKSDG